METTPNDETAFFHKGNVLICWNHDDEKEMDFATQLKNDKFNVATSYAEFKEKYKEPDKNIDLKNKPDKRRKPKQIPVEVRIEGLVVLCELTWGLSTEMGIRDSPLSAMNGIKFIKELRIQKVAIPVVFVSFLSRAQQLKLSTSNEIICTPALGHFYRQLPSNPYKWFEILNKFKQKRIDDLELEDVISHFCMPEGMLSELKHDLRKYLDSNANDRAQKFVAVFRRIEDILGYSAKSKIEELEKMKHISDKEYKDKIEGISRAIDELIRELSPLRLSSTKPSKQIQVVLLDDEFDSDKRFETLIDLMVSNNIDVYHFSNPDEAFKKVENDKENLIDIIISDYRIWNEFNDDDPRLLQQIQGYSFLKKCAGLGRTYTYVILSALDRNFLMKHLRLQTETLYKNGVLANEYSILNFIRNLIIWGEANQNSIAGNISNNEVFIECYNWYRSNSANLGIESKIYIKIEDCLKQFDKMVISHSLELCNYAKNHQSCSKCNLFNTISKSSFKIPIISDFTTNYHNKKGKWNPQNKKDILNLINKFAARRLLMYYYFNLSNVKINCSLAKPISEKLLQIGTYYGQCPKLDPAKSLWLTKDFKMMPVEIEFLKYPPHLCEHN